jgi:hypothetical protein
LEKEAAFLGGSRKTGKASVVVIPSAARDLFWVLKRIEDASRKSGIQELREEKCKLFFRKTSISWATAVT